MPTEHLYFTHCISDFFLFFNFKFFVFHLNVHNEKATHFFTGKNLKCTVSALLVSFVVNLKIWVQYLEII